MKALESETFDPTRTRQIIVNSEMVKREILANFRFPAERIHLVRNGVDVARFQSGRGAETRARFGVKNDEYLLLFVGSGWERKGLKFVIEAVETIAALPPSDNPIAASVLEYAKSTGIQTEVPRRKVKLLVVGKGKPLHSRSGNVIFAGSMSNVEDAYAAADLFVFLPIYEPSSNVVYEALAAGLPVVTSTYNGASELIEPDVNGTVIDLSNVDFPLKVFESLARWERRTSVNPTVDNAAVSLDRNVSETLAILEMAAKERNA
jgi:UDP-glucose:(heptosyl)LPS alpha-1,3-glucosyltransferase